MYVDVTVGGRGKTRTTGPPRYGSYESEKKGLTLVRSHKIWLLAKEKAHDAQYEVNISKSNKSNILKMEWEM